MSKAGVTRTSWRYDRCDFSTGGQKRQDYAREHVKARPARSAAHGKPFWIMSGRTLS
jgi:hypothetical protein